MCTYMYNARGQTPRTIGWNYRSIIRTVIRHNGGFLSAIPSNRQARSSRYYAWFLRIVIVSIENSHIKIATSTVRSTGTETRFTQNKRGSSFLLCLCHYSRNHSRENSNSILHVTREIFSNEWIVIIFLTSITI